MSPIEDETRLYVASTGAKYRIQIFHDDQPPNPWTDWDGTPPLLSTDGGDYSGRYDLRDPLAYLSDSTIKRNLLELRDMFLFWGGVPVGDPAANFDSYVRTLYDGTLRECRRQYFSECLQVLKGDSKDFETLARLWEMAGAPVLLTESRGYCQGDWCRLLIVAHPEAVKDWGFRSLAAYRKACPKDLANTALLFGAYTWGGVIGIKVGAIDPEEWAELDDPDPDATDLNGLRECQEVESCWGYYPEGTQDYLPIETAHAYALSEARDWAEDHATTAQAETDSAMAIDIAAARPDLAPIWEGVGA
jgi:hypothetical protein